jgi:hypothetical protein
MIFSRENIILAPKLLPVLLLTPQTTNIPTPTLQTIKTLKKKMLNLAKYPHITPATCHFSIKN